MTIQFTPLFDRVLVQRDMVEKTRDGVLMPSAAFRNHDQVGMEFNTASVLKVGDGCEHPLIKPGARVLVGKYAFESGAGGAMGTSGAKICLNLAEVMAGNATDEEYAWVVMEKDIIGVLDEEKTNA